MAKTKRKKTGTKKASLRERMAKKKEELKRRSSRSSILRQKDEGTMRIRILNPGEDEEFVIETTQFWLGNDIGSVISPVTFGEPCAIYEKYQELKESKDEDEKALAKKLIPKLKYVTPVAIYKDDKGKKVDPDNSGKLLQITGGVYQDILDLYLDEDEWGDMIDSKDGYDIKITREGKGIKDTSYTVMPCKNTPAPKEFRKIVDIKEMLKDEVDTYEETLSKVEQFLGASYDDDDEPQEKPKRKKKKGKRKKDI